MDEIARGFIRAVELIIELNPEVIEVTLRSFLIALTSVTIASLINVPLGSLIHFHHFPGRSGLINLIQTLYSIPTVTVGLFVFLLISREGPLGGYGLLYTPYGMIIGQTVLITPVILGLTISALSSVSEDIRDTAVSLGADRFQTMWTVIVEARGPVLAAVLLGFGRALSEVGVAMMIGGNIRGYTRVLTTAIALETSMGNLEISIALGLILISIALVVNTVVGRLQGW
ncbi:MAG: ABC transporter permease [Methanothrix sp.]|uniref:Binding-protein-dependent transport systems inner membrane component n=1 Tax=Methanothrix thermoacetophila (strain DSM 6194 / JCM 14653 / NBRC 101360 / PT) TaxID=349307 RepID=A0B8G0_METTP|nr:MULTISPECIES: ABC transporter permease [Methanothrix]ABK14984.1 binding-protein-dependent transport systems inner membrane component [Methanothrix thermoacetophila PT]MBC7080423.1 ABC transporter permease [Methanothrix sp.]NPU86893.1 ABC transporter permease [Methanothrix sp.]HOK58065.1 ABC transporter permease [Methanothrix sp.]HOL43468.1 ABC transporter permease [Methanothrix sp.]